MTSMTKLDAGEKLRERCLGKYGIEKWNDKGYRMAAVG